MDSNQAPQLSKEDEDRLGINKASKGIKKSSINQTNCPNPNSNQLQHPQIYNVSKKDFRDMVQRMTGPPRREPLPKSNPKPPNESSMRILPPPLIPTAHPRPLNSASNSNDMNSIVDSSPHNVPPQPPPPENVISTEVLSPTAEYLLSLPTDFLNPSPYFSMSLSPTWRSQ